MTFDLQNPIPLSGDELRDYAANLLQSKYGNVRIEHREDGKKTDIFFTDHQFGKEVRFYVEAKDYSVRLKRQEVVTIWADYEGILKKHAPAQLLIITRSGLAPDAAKYVNDERPDTIHNTIWQLEDEILGITDYIRYLQDTASENKLDQYYIQTRAYPVVYGDGLKRTTGSKSIKLIDRIQDWIEADDASPIAVLGGYGAGKTCFTKILASSQAKKALSNPKARRPVLIKLGAFSRYSNVEGILGAMFTSEFPVKSFSAQRFMSMNRAGRLLIILDGFDEMKHAMSWADFRIQVNELKKFMDGDARILLLGRPSAFLSQEEHMQVLKGRRRSGDDWLRIPDWPDFIEYEVAQFDESERDEFIRRYLTAYAEGSQGSEWIENRVQEVSTLAALDDEIFSKPVHAKILTELALEPSIDLSKFQTGVSRWQLYELFFGMLAERESSKEARRAISDKARLDFLREIAFWLWSDNQGATSFASTEVPERILANLPFFDASENDVKCREYLTGSFLEKKDGEIFYFSHRSFAEFLVAQRMVLNPPQGETHATYAALIADGVELFLKEGASAIIAKDWTNSLSDARGKIPVEYLRFLATASGGYAKFLGRFDEASPWRTVIEVIGESFDVNESIIGRAIFAMRTPKNDTMGVLYSLVSLAWQIGEVQNGRVRKYGPRIVATILDRLFEEAALVPNTIAKFRIGRSKRETRDLALKCLSRLVVRRERYLLFDWSEFAHAMVEGARNVGFSLTMRGGEFAEMIWTKPVEFPLDDIIPHLRPANRQKVELFFAHNQSLAAIEVPGAR